MERMESMNILDPHKVNNTSVFSFLFELFIMLKGLVTPEKSHIFHTI